MEALNLGHEIGLALLKSKIDHFQLFLRIHSHFLYRYLLSVGTLVFCSREEQNCSVCCLKGYYYHWNKYTECVLDSLKSLDIG